MRLRPRISIGVVLVATAAVFLPLNCAAPARGWIQPGRADSPLAKQLAEGELNTKEPGESERQPPRAAAGPSAPASGAAGSGGASPAPAEARGPTTRGPTTGDSGGRIHAGGVGADDGPIGRGHRPAHGGAYTGPGGSVLSGTAGDRQPTRTWQRSGEQPSFARVYVGNGNALVLEKMRVTVKVEGPRARTVVDHVFKNPHARPLEGTFEYPLPTGATVSYYAMFLSADQTRAPEFFPPGALEALPVGGLARMPPADAMRRAGDKWGKLREARVVVREKARQVYEEIVRRDTDPALLEYAGGNTFRGRVFPIPANGYNRVVIAYEQRLDVEDGRVTYRFRLPDCEVGLLHVSGVLPRQGVRDESWSPAEGAVRKEADGRITYEQVWERTKGPAGELQWSYRPRNRRVQSITSEDPTSDDRVFFARLRPELSDNVERTGRRHAVFLLDTSLSEHPDRFATNLDILREILQQDTAIERFNVLCFDVGASWVSAPGWLANTRAGRGHAIDRLQQVLLEGATDLSHAISVLAATEWIDAETPLHVFLLSDGQINHGDADAGRILQALAGRDVRFFCYRTGLSAENLELFGELTRKGGGVFNVFTRAMARRAALAHRRSAFVLEDLRVETDGTTRDVVVAGRRAAIFPGGELVVAGRYRGATEATAVLRGRLDGRPTELRFAIPLRAGGELAARGWAEITVQQMLALRHPDVDRLAAAYSQRFHIGSRLTSFLVLETDAAYERFGIEEEARELEVDDVAALLEERYRKRQVASRRVAFGRFLRQVAGRVKLLEKGTSEHVQALFACLDEKDFARDDPRPVPLPLERMVPRSFLNARAADRESVALWTGEAERRVRARAPRFARRALSSIVELHPGRSDALRLVGYRLLALQEPALAAELFEQVRVERPFEPHSYRDIARSLAAAGRPALAAIHYELVLAGDWHPRFRDSLQVVAREEYVGLLRRTLARNTSPRLRALFEQRLRALGGTETAAKLRVTISWNTDNTDVDLWVVGPRGVACGYSNNTTEAGGELLDDLTRGYGPERYRNVDGLAGEYVVLVKYYARNPNLLGGETYVDVDVVRHAGMPDEESRRFHVILTRDHEAAEVCRVRI